MGKHYNIVITLDKFQRLLMDEKVYFSHKPIKHGNNIFIHQLIRLALGETVIMDGYEYTATLEKDIDIKEIALALCESSLNPVFQVFRIFMIEYVKIKEKLAQ